jgi:hypothetical protein
MAYLNCFGYSLTIWIDIDSIMKGIHFDFKRKSVEL